MIQHRIAKTHDNRHKNSGKNFHFTKGIWHITRNNHQHNTIEYNIKNAKRQEIDRNSEKADYRHHKRVEQAKYRRRTH